MPQMAPLLWLMLFMTFILLCIFSSAKMYFNTPKIMDMKINTTKKESMNLINWTW